MQRCRANKSSLRSVALSFRSDAMIRISRFPKTFLMFAIGLGCAAALADEPVGVVSHLNLVSDKSQDISTLEAWKKTYITDGMSDQDKAIAIFNTVVRYRHQANPP